MKFEVLATADGHPRHDVTIHRAGASSECPGCCAHDSEFFYEPSYIIADASELQPQQALCRHPTCYPVPDGSAPLTLGEYLVRLDALQAAVRPDAPVIRESEAGLDDLRRLASQSQDPDETVRLSAEILKRDPRDIAALNRIGRSYQALREKAKAIEMFERVLKLDPGNNIATGRLRQLRRS
jgi:tetratricopeptide (TPR) repeat protein